LYHQQFCSAGCCKTIGARATPSGNFSPTSQHAAARGARPGENSILSLHQYFPRVPIDEACSSYTAVALYMIDSLVTLKLWSSLEQWSTCAKTAESQSKLLRKQAWAWLKELRAQAGRRGPVPFNGNQKKVAASSPCVRRQARCGIEPDRRADAFASANDKPGLAALADADAERGCRSVMVSAGLLKPRHCDVSEVQLHFMLRFCSAIARVRRCF
jgi:hypothetical protein